MMIASHIVAVSLDVNQILNKVWTALNLLNVEVSKRMSSKLESKGEGRDWELSQDGCHFSPE